MLFLFAVVLLIAITNVLVTLFLYFAGAFGAHTVDQQATIVGVMSSFSWERFTWISIGVVSTVALVILLKWIQLAGGGGAPFLLRR